MSGIYKKIDIKYKVDHLLCYENEKVFELKNDNDSLNVSFGITNLKYQILILIVIKR